MDLGAIAAALASYLAPLLPYLHKGAEKGVETVGEKLGEGVWEKAKDIWDQLRSPVEASPTANEAVEDILASPDDANARTRLALGLTKILSRDPGLAKGLAELLKAAAPLVGYRASAADEALIAQDRGVAARQVAVGRDVQGNVIVIQVDAGRMDPERLLRAVSRRAADLDLERATTRYLEYLVDRFRYLDFRGMGVSDRVPLQLPLLDLYIPLKARVGTPEGETWARDLKLAGRRVSEEEAEAIGRRVSEPQPVLSLLGEHDGLIVLGDPGAGKTTFLKFLALSLATGQGEALGLGTRLPVLAPLSAYATALSGRKKALPLDRFIEAHYRDRGVDLSIGTLLAESLDSGGTLLLLDGLDEVRDPGERRRVVDLVTDFFAVHRKAGNKFVLTSRIVGYPEVRPRVAGLAECTLADLEPEEIGDFVGKWTAAVERAALGQGRVAAFEAEREREELLSAVHRNPGVRALAVNPLLLTILALMKRQGITLPERRVELYQKYVETLLKHWNLARSLAGRVGRDLDVVETVRILAPLALWMHRTSPGVGLVPKAGLERELEHVYRARGHADPERAARDFLDDVREHASLLLDRGGNQFGFIHLTFQEYLAGVALAQKGQQVVAPVVEELGAHIGDATWREVSLLAVGYLGIVQQRDEAAGGVLETLIEQAPGEPGEAVVLAGEAVADVGSGGVTPAVRERVVQGLLATMRDDRHVEAARRAAAGRMLGRIGDPRFRADAWLLPAEPLLGFVEITAGPFRMGIRPEDIPSLIERFGGQRDWYDQEVPQHPVSLPLYLSFALSSDGGPVPRLRRGQGVPGVRRGNPPRGAEPSGRSGELA